MFDYERLRNDLMDYYGTAAFSGFPMAFGDVVDIKHASYDELLDKADDAGFDLNKYRY